MEQTIGLNRSERICFLPFPSALLSVENPFCPPDVSARLSEPRTWNRHGFSFITGSTFTGFHSAKLAAFVLRAGNGLRWERQASQVCEP